MYVLLVEDDPRVARVVERALAEADHRVDVAHDGEEGLARAESGAYDLIVLDVQRGEARREDRTIELTAKEFDLLAYLMRNAGRVLTKPQMIDHVWGYDNEATSNVVEIYIHYLRDKIDRGFARPLIRTVRGVGYTIKP